MLDFSDIENTAAVPEKDAAGRWRLRCSTLLLTYMYGDNNDGPPPEEVRQKIVTAGGKCTIGVEIAPTTGRKHLHAFVQMPPKWNTRSSRFFDVYTYHPNITQIKKTPHLAYDYCIKGGNVPVHDLERPVPISRKRGLDEVFRDSLDQATYEGMLKVLEDEAPLRFTTCYNNIRACANDRYNKRLRTEYEHPRDAVFDTSPWPEIDEWRAAYLANEPDTELGRNIAGNTEATPELTDGSTADASSVFSIDDWGLEPPSEASGFCAYSEDSGAGSRYVSPEPRAMVPKVTFKQRPKSLIIWGPTRTGKTCWARSLGKHVHHSGTTNMAEHQDAADYAIFDDMEDGLKGFNYKSWLGGQLHFNVTDKYVKKMEINWGKPSIYITNDDPFDGSRGIDFEWLRANTVCVHIDQPMYLDEH